MAIMGKQIHIQSKTLLLYEQLTHYLNMFCGAFPGNLPFLNRRKPMHKQVNENH